MRTIVIDRRFNGPKGSGNGGYVAGILAGHIDPEGVVEVTLRAPVPLDTPMDLSPAGDGYRLTAGGRLICEARRAALTLDAPGAGDWAEMERLAEGGGSAAGTDFHDCLVCGRGRAPGDGLRVWGDRAAGGGRSLSRYLPHPVHAGDDGRIRPEFVWGALDCPGAWAAQDADDPRPALTGRMTARIFDRPRPGLRCMVVGWKAGGAGRKLISGTALYGEDGTLYAQGECVWIVLKSG